MRAIASTVNNLYVSTNPTMVVTDLTTAAANNVRYDLLAVTINSGTAAMVTGIDLVINEPIFLIFQGAGTAILYLD